MGTGEIIDIFIALGFSPGRLISGSKSGYRARNPENLVVFNANILLPSKGKIWHGDLDLTLDEPNLQKVANIIGETLWVLREHDARFGSENNPIEVLERNVVLKIIPRN